MFLLAVGASMIAISILISGSVLSAVGGGAFLTFGVGSLLEASRLK